MKVKQDIRPALISEESFKCLNELRGVRHYFRHAYEFSLIGATTENVANYIQKGQFGLWEETGHVNEIVNQAYKEAETGMGEAIGKVIYEGDFPYKDISLLAACYK